MREYMTMVYEDDVRLHMFVDSAKTLEVVGDMYNCPVHVIDGLDIVQSDFMGRINLKLDEVSGSDITTRKYVITAEGIVEENGVVVAKTAVIRTEFNNVTFITAFDVSED